MDINESVIVVGGLARNCEYNLCRNLDEIEKLRPYVKELYICILENDSTDNTPQIMDRFCSSHKNVKVVHFKETQFDVSAVSGASMSRICRLTKYRNMLLDMMRSCTNDADFDVIIDYDLDELNSLQIIKAIENAPVEWGALFADGRYKWQYRDKIQTAFRDKRKIYDSFAILESNRRIESIISFDNCSLAKFKKAVAFGTLLNKERFIPCRSAFGGVGIYKHEVLVGCKYSTFKVGDFYVCEHIYLNNSIAEKGYMNYITSELKTCVLMQQDNIFSYYFNKYLPPIHDLMVSLYLRLKHN